MIRTLRPLRGKKLLVASIGIGTVTFAMCSLFPGCNLGAPYPYPYPDPQYDLATPPDANLDAAPAQDGSTDAAKKGD